MTNIRAVHIKPDHPGRIGAVIRCRDLEKAGYGCVYNPPL